MSDRLKPLRQSLIDFIETFRVQVSAVLPAGIAEGEGTRDAESLADPDFQGWLHGDPMVTKNPASRYGERTPGYVTGNGLGSMEIGAADD